MGNFLQEKYTYRPMILFYGYNIFIIANAADEERPKGVLFDPLVVRHFVPNNQRILLIRIVVEARSVLDNNELSGLTA